VFTLPKADSDFDTLSRIYPFFHSVKHSIRHQAEADSSFEIVGEGGGGVFLLLMYDYLLLKDCERADSDFFFLHYSCMITYCYRIVGREF
jgi:hypothetical protein